MNEMLDEGDPNYDYIIGRVRDIRLTPEQFKKLHSLKSHSKLEKEIKKISSFKYAEFVHYTDIGYGSGCGLKSVVKIGSDTSDEDVFFCIYCDRDFQMDKWDFRYSGIRPAL